MAEQSEKFNKETENIRTYQIEVTQLKNTITELKNTLEGFNSRPDKAEEMISKFEDRAVEITQSEQQKEKRMKKSQDSFRDS